MTAPTVCILDPVAGGRPIMKLSIAKRKATFTVIALR